MFLFYPLIQSERLCLDSLVCGDIFSDAAATCTRIHNQLHVRPLKANVLWHQYNVAHKAQKKLKICPRTFL